MIDIILNEKNIFTYDNENISIGIHNEDLGFRHIGNIKFSSIKQAEHFAEMIELMKEIKNG